MFDELPVVALDRDYDSPVDMDPEEWPWAIPAVRDLLDRRRDLGRLTVLVGENGSGKSTIVEAIAQRYGLSPEGGSTGAQHSTRPSESELVRALKIFRGRGAARWGFFLRAETMHGFYTYLEHHPAGPLGEGEDRRPEPLHEMSHGESFVEVLQTRFHDPGLYVLDEPESALSFTGCLALVDLLHTIANDHTRQAIVATHSPVVAATPGATILEVGDWGLRETTWDELDLVQNWRDFLTRPELFLGPLLDGP